MRTKICPARWLLLVLCLEIAGCGSSDRAAARKSGDPSRVTLENGYKIQRGMTRAEVEAILGTVHRIGPDPINPDRQVFGWNNGKKCIFVLMHKDEIAEGWFGTGWN